MLIDHDVVGYVEAEPGANSLRLRREEWLEDARRDLRRNARAAVGDPYFHGVAEAAGAHFEHALAVHGLDRVVDDVRPDLVQLPAECLDAGQVGFDLEDDVDAVLELVAED